MHISKAALLLLCVGLALFFGCSKGSDSTNQPSTAPVVPATPMMMMKEDPRSIMSVEGVIQEIDENHLVVHTKKNVSLKFQRDGKTDVIPSGKKLAVGMNVKIDIDHIPVGMRAKSVTVEGENKGI